MRESDLSARSRGILGGHADVARLLLETGAFLSNAELERFKFARHAGSVLSNASVGIECCVTNPDVDITSPCLPWHIGLLT